MPRIERKKSTRLRQSEPSNKQCTISHMTRAPESPRFIQQLLAPSDTFRIRRALDGPRQMRKKKQENLDEARHTRFLRSSFRLVGHVDL